MIPARLSLVTLGVADVSRARRFYEAWGWVAAAESQQQITFFQLCGLVLALYDRSALSRDMGGRAVATGATTLAINFHDRAEVDTAFARALAAGAERLTGPEETHYGGYVGYLADPDRNVWEFARVPAFVPAADGTLTLPSLAPKIAPER